MSPVACNVLSCLSALSSSVPTAVRLLCDPFYIPSLLDVFLSDQINRTYLFHARRLSSPGHPGFVSDGAVGSARSGGASGRAALIPWS